MEELMQVFLEAGVSENEAEGAIAFLELTSVDDLRFYSKLEDYADAGITRKSAQRNLVSYAERLITKHEAEKAMEIESKRTRAGIEAEAKAEAEVELAEKKRREEAVVALEDVYKDESSWMEAVQQENTLQFTPNTYAAGIKAVLASNIGLFQATPKLMKLLDSYAKANARPVHKAFYKLQTLMTERTDGLIVGAANGMVIDDVPIYASEKDMTELINDINKELVPVVMLTVEKVGTWYASYGARAMDEFFVSQTTGGASAQYPNTAPLTEAARELRAAVNRAFAGNGIQKSLAICYQYSKFAEILNVDDLPQAIGAVDKDALLAQLGLDPSAAAVRSEKAIINFVLHAMETDKCSEEDELRHCIGLFNLADKIDWSGLTGKRSDANIMDKFRPGRRLTGMTQSLLGNEQHYVAQQTVIEDRMQQMDGQPARLEVGMGIGAGRDC